MLLCGIGASNITATPGTPLGGYWGRDPSLGTTGTADPLFCKVLTLNKLNDSGTKNWFCIVSLDLIGLHASTCQFIKKDIIASVQGGLTLDSNTIMICCTHTHTGPQTHTSFIGMGHVSEVYQRLLRKGVVNAFQESLGNISPATLYHGKTKPLRQVGINRRQRVTAKESTPPTPKEAGHVKWFEKAGRTILGQRPEGPKMDSAEVLQFVRESDTKTILATVVIYACHPTTIGPLLDQSSDFCGALVASLEQHTKAPAMYLNGCCGDVNPFFHRSGYNGAVQMGQRIAAAVIQTTQQRTTTHLYGLARIASSRIDLTSDLKKIKLPLNPLPKVEEAASFFKEQQEWLKEEEDKQEESNTRGARTAAPKACCDYAQRVHQECQAATTATTATTSTTSTTATTATTASSLPFRIQSVSLGPVAIVGMEGEMFSEYQLSIDRASPFEKTTIVVGYTNGCIGYVPTENEYSFGGYECCHSFRVYGRSTDISPTSERVIMHTTMSMLHGLKYNYHTMPVSMLQDAVKHKRQTPFANRFAKKGVLVADTFESHFPLAHDTYNAMGVDAQNKYVYYVLSSESMAGARTGARLYRVPCSSRGLDQMHSRFVDPKDQGGGVEELGDLTIAMQDPLNCVVQGKSHVPLIDCGAALGIVFGTHVGYYSFVDGMETLPQPKDLPSHVKPYPGGGVLSFIPDSNKGTFQVHARVPDGEGVLTMAVDPTRKRAYYLTWPSGKFGTTALYTSQADHDAKSVEEHTLANTLFEYKGRGQGESVHPSTGLYRCVCRSMVVDPKTGHVYWSNADGDVLRWHCLDNNIAVVWLGGLKRDYFGTYVSSDPGHMGYHWRQVKWWNGCIVGVHGNSGYLFRVQVPKEVVRGGEGGEGGKGGEGECKTETLGVVNFEKEPWHLEIVERLTSVPSRKRGQGDHFSYGYLGFDVSGEGVVTYLTGAPIFRPGDETGMYGLLHGEGKDTKKGEAKGLEHCHCVTYDMKTDVYKDHGRIVYGNRVGFPTYVNSIAVGREGGWVFALGRVGEETGEGLTDCFRFQIGC